MDDWPEIEVLTTPTLVPAYHPLCQQRQLAGWSPKVVVPYTKHYPEAEQAVRDAHIDALYAPCPGPTDYWAYVHELWGYGETFVTIEHDICPRPGDLEKLLSCPEPWCGFLHCIGTIYHPCLGFAKFDATLMQRYPQALEWVGERVMADDGAVQRSWVRLDTRLWQFLQNQGETIHAHTPPVPHLNPQQVIQAEVDRGWCYWPLRPTEP